jgi:hypothetical protein
VIVTGLCSGLAFAPHAGAQNVAHLALDVRSACPDRSLIISELTPLLRGYELSDSDDSLAVVAQVEDLGESYRVSIAEGSRTVSDPRRQCLERARVAAVFVALNLPPATPAAPATPPTLAKDVPAEAAVPTPPVRALALDLRPFVQAETAWGAGVASSGIGLGASLQLRQVAVTLLAGATTATTPYQAAGEPPTFELQRLPLAALIGWEAGLGLLDVGAEAGPALDVLRFRGEAVPNPDAALRVNAGVRVNGVVRVRASRRLAAELMPILSWFPRTYVVELDPGRVLAETPRLWLGVSLGLSCEIWGG